MGPPDAWEAQEHPHADQPVEHAAPPTFTPMMEDEAAPAQPSPEPTPRPTVSASHGARTKGVFKPSPLFSQIAPVEAVPVAAPDPIVIGFEALRLSISPARIELRYRITLRNESTSPLGPFRVEACMGTNEGHLSQTWQEHGLDLLMPGQDGAIHGEWRLPLSGVPTLRVGAVHLLVGAARIIVRAAPLPHGLERDFLIGLPEEDGRLVPIPLDVNARIHEHLITQAIQPAPARPL